VTAAGRGRFLSLAYLTVAGTAPPEQVTAAAGAGYKGVGLRLTGARPGDPVSSVARERGTLEETERRLAGSGLEVLDVEVIRITPQWRVADEAPAIEWAARLGAKHLLVLSFDQDESRTVDAFVALCHAAAGLGLRAVLEFARFSGVRSLGQALRVLERAAQPNAGLLVDTLHLIRSGAAPADLRPLAPARLPYVQLCDARAAGPAETETADSAALVEEALFDRLLPGEGALPLGEILGALPDGIPISVEAPSRALATAAPAIRAQRAAEATRLVLRRLAGST
jgi:sugar phosphate isomerase/epimerase